MMDHKIVLIGLLLILSSAKVTIQNTRTEFTPQDELEYINYLKVIMGRHDEATTLSPALQEFAREHRPSLANAPDHIMLAFMQHPSKEDTHHSEDKKEQLELKGNLLQQFIKETPHLFQVTSLPPNQEALIDSMIEKNQLVHIIRGTAKEIKRLAALFDRERKSSIARHRRLQELPEPMADQEQGTYLIKFFFSLLFVFVLIASVSVISSSDNKKDTLLYAKFTTDANVR